jgi:glycerol-3-phosphate acyltransferase PlsY
MNIAAWIGFPLFGYLMGSLPFALWVTRLVKGIDVRDGGSGHVTSTNTIRQAGFAPGALVLLLDIGKGFLPTFLAARSDSPDLLIVLTAAMGVVGHCWPVFAQFRGGMGLAVTAGSYLAVEPIGFAIGTAVLIALTLIIHHSARAAFFAAFVIPVAMWVLGFRDTILFVAIGTGLVVAIRFTIDWNREYRELWLDRDKESP